MFIQKLSNVQPSLTPYRAHAHKRLINRLNRVPEHDSHTERNVNERGVPPPFSCCTEQNVNQLILNGSVSPT